MFQILVPVAIAVAGLTGAAVYRKRKSVPVGVLTPDRERIYTQAMNTLADPAGLRQLAAAFENAKLFSHAEMLRKRAALRELPDDVKKARRDAFKSVMASTDKKAVLAFAQKMQDEGCTGAAAKLRERAAGLV